MFLIPLNQVESVELVVHALRVAGGEADCGSCPARKVCMKQCLTIADSVERMLKDGTLSLFAGQEEAPAPAVSDPDGSPERPPRGGHLKRVK